MHSIRRSAAAILVLSLSAAPAFEAQAPMAPVDSHMYAGLTWRNLGPFRGGRTASVTGAIGQPGVFYFGAPAGGIWKTTNSGAMWYPVFDSIKSVSSVGSIDVAPSNPNVIYAGTGDIVTGGAINEGNGVYKSTDAGHTWQHMGLDATKQIPTLLVDVKDPNVVLVGAQGDLHSKSHDRGVFRSTDGGATWSQTLFVDDSTGAQWMSRAFDTPNTIFVTTVAHYQPPPGQQPAGGFGGGRGNMRATGPTSTKLYKSTDNGVTWQEISGGGLPHLTGKMWVAVANRTNAQRVFVIGDWGLYRSDDGGATWRQMAADDPRIRNGQGGYNCGVYLDPQNPDIVYTLNTASYRSTDGGQTFTGFKGAPGGDDPQRMWIDPTNGQRILFGYDQGAIVSLDGGASWSSWYNQSVEQIYHLSVDNSFPYWVYGSQQDAGAVRTRSRGNLGAITPLDWNPVSGWEWGTIIPDPLDPNTVYASGSGILRITYPSEQWINVSPAQDPSRRLRTAFSQPIVFAPWDKHMLIAGFQSVWTTTDSGAHWTAISPDLGVRQGTGPTPPTAPGLNAPPGGAIESIGPSTVQAGMIWVGTNNGLIKMTRDGGKTWDGGTVDAAIPNIDRAEVLYVDPSHFDAAEAYTAVDLHRIGDYTPYFYRTRDYGKTWTRITSGLPVGQPSGSFARLIRNDTKRRGLLFAGTETAMYVSFDDGDHWQSLQQNLPTTSYRDAVIKDNDLVVSTYGRGFWSLDDFSMLRQVSPAIASEPAHLFKPGDAFRVRRNVGADTPFPPEVPHAENPLPGVPVDYWLARAPSSDITLDVLDASGAVVHHMTSASTPPVPEAKYPPEPNFWLAPTPQLPKNAGGNRTNWNLRYDDPHSFVHSFEINANPDETPASPEGPIVVPGTYTLRLTVDGRPYTQTVVVHNDPRSPATLAAIEAQHALQMKIVDGMEASYEGHRLATALRDLLRGPTPAGAAPETSAPSARALALAAQLDTVAGLDAGRGRGGGRGFGRNPIPNFTAINGALGQQLNAQENGDMAPTPAALAAFGATCHELETVTTAWRRLSTEELTAVNAERKEAGRGPLAVPTGALKPLSCQ